MSTTDQDSIVATTYWHRLDDGRVQCDLCPRLCKLLDGQQGLCFIRANHDNAVVLTSYGRSSGFCIDPIEKKPLNHFLPGSPVLSFGTAGCNLACKFCQNWDISKSRETRTLASHASADTIAQVAAEYHCQSIAFTYNDPVIFLEYARDVAEACHERQIKTVAVTAGYISPEPRQAFFRFFDAANIDLKAFSEAFYWKVTGGHLAPVLDTLIYLRHETTVWFELTTLLIPGMNDSDEEIDQMTRWVVENLGADVPMHFTAFHPDWKLQDIGSTPAKTVKHACKIARANGVHYVYSGNIYDPDGQATHCQHCGETIIGRDGYEITVWNLVDGGRCQNCGEFCPGVFADTPGHWGSRRQTISLM